MGKSALITGVTGQDGAYLSELLLGKGYEVYGAQRRTSSTNDWRLRELNVADRINYVSLDLAEESNIYRLIRSLKVDEIYNLAAQSFVSTSFEQPIYTTQINAVSVCRLLEAIRLTERPIKFYQASTSEMFGKSVETPQSETTPFYPRSPYGISKLYGHWTTVNYRESYGMFACSGILFNHESPLRGSEFVTRKSVIALARLRHGGTATLKLGNLNARRDWGFAGDYVAAMWAMLQNPTPDDYVVATGKTWSIRDFVSLAGASFDFEIEWKGEGEDEIGVDRRSGRTLIEVDPQFYRPAEVDILMGSAKKAMERLNWRPEVSFEQLVEMMARTEYDRISRQH